MLPISAPAFVVAAIWQFTSIWNDFLFAVFIITDPSQWPVTVALNNTTGSLVTPYNLQMSAAPCSRRCRPSSSTSCSAGTSCAG